jgi:hypothetical protein
MADIVIDTCASTSTTSDLTAVVLGEGATNQVNNSGNIAIGQRANAYAGNCISIGQDAGGGTLIGGQQSITIGVRAGYGGQGQQSVALGYFSGNSQGSYSVAVGPYCGESGQADRSVAIGSAAGQSNQSTKSVAIGNSCGAASQGQQSIAIGCNTGYNNQGDNAIAIGFEAAFDASTSGQSAYAIAMGYQAGYENQGTYSIAIGASAGKTSQPANSIVINASGTELDGATTNACYINPIRSTTGTTPVIMAYDTTTSEVIVPPPSFAPEISGANITTATIPVSAINGTVPIETTWTVTTIDNTPTQIFAITMPTDGLLILDGVLSGPSSDYSQGVAVKYFVSAISAGGVATLLDDPFFVMIKSSSHVTYVNFSIDGTGTQLVATVYGKNGSTINWSTTYSSYVS